MPNKMKPVDYEYQKAEHEYAVRKMSVRISLYPLCISMFMLMYALLSVGFEHETWVTLRLSGYACLASVVWLFAVAIFVVIHTPKREVVK